MTIGYSETFVKPTRVTVTDIDCSKLPTTSRLKSYQMPMKYEMKMKIPRVEKLKCQRESISQIHVLAEGHFPNPQPIMGSGSIYTSS